MSQDASKEAAERLAQRPGKVLLVDDQPELRRMWRRSLSREGHEVVDAGNGRAAIEQARLTSFDLVISDVQMPDMDGIELLEGLLLLDPDVPVILVSGAFDPKIERLAARLGVFDYLLKPVTFESMNARAARAIAVRRARAEATAEFEPYASVERLRVHLAQPPLAAELRGRR